MKRSVLAGLCLAVSLAAAPGAALIPEVSVCAATTAVSGTITSDSTADIMCLDMGTGVMKIRLDSNTDLSESGVLIAGAEVSADVYRGSDAYMHASKISAQKQAAVTVDRENSVTADGTVQSGTTASLLLLSTSSGDMKIRIDSSTDVAGAGMIVTGKRLSVTAARGSDAYMHALKITDSSQKTQTSQASSSLISISGSPEERSDDDTMYLSTSGGTMIIKLDSQTKMETKAYMPGHTVNVTLYHGTDGYLHAQSVSDTTWKSQDAAADTSNPVEIRGSVASGSTLNQLNFRGSDGMIYKIRLDNNTSVDVRVIKTGKELKISFGNSTDGYLHAISVRDSRAADYAQNGSSRYISVTGTPESRSDDGTMYLSTPEGTMIIRLDSETEMNSKTYVPGRSVRVSVYHGNDGYLHAQSVTDESWKGQTISWNDTRIQVSGTVQSGTDVNLLQLGGNDGSVYKIRIDSGTQSSIRALKEGRSIAVTVAGAGDGYLHAVEIR